LSGIGAAPRRHRRQLFAVLLTGAFGQVIAQPRESSSR
jgi:hypothetical protein